MADAADFWQRCASVLRQANSFVLMIVAATQGSTPSKTGAKMILTAAGETFGTIGGGALEHAMLAKAKSLLVAGITTAYLYSTDDKAEGLTERLDTICGGAQTIVLFPCQPAHLAVIEELGARCATHSEALLNVDSKGLEIQSIDNLAFNGDHTFTYAPAWRYQERIGGRNCAYLVGGGHVSLALSQVLALLDFDITVLDNREELATLRANPYARRKLHCCYEELPERVPEGNRSFVFIMTHNHRYDERAVACLAGKNYRYLGVLGSCNKIAQLKASLASRADPAWLQSLHAPMGLPIGSHKPAEIAVSIAAEVVQLLNADTKS